MDKPGFLFFIYRPPLQRVRDDKGTRDSSARWPGQTRYEEAHSGVVSRDDSFPAKPGRHGGFASGTGDTLSFRAMLIGGPYVAPHSNKLGQVGLTVAGLLEKPGDMSLDTRPDQLNRNTQVDCPLNQAVRVFIHPLPWGPSYPCRVGPRLLHLSWRQKSPARLL